MFSAGDDYTSKKGSVKRQMTINDVPVGVYQLDFIISNDDNLFGDVPSQTIKVSGGKTTNVVQGFDPRYGTIEAITKTPSNVLPAITLYDATGKTIETKKGRLSVGNLFPAHSA